MRAAADVGGTFTDVLLQLPGGEIAYHKVLSSPPAYDVAVARDGVDLSPTTTSGAATTTGAAK